jgi:hypothetical protein
VPRKTARAYHDLTSRCPKWTAFGGAWRTPGLGGRERLSSS